MAETIAIHTSSGPIDTAAEVFGDWAVHPAHYGDGTWATEGDWVVTYVPNGKRLVRCDDVSMARAMARHVRDAAWDPTAEDRRERWLALIEAFEGRHPVDIDRHPVHGWLMDTVPVEPDDG